MVTKLFGQGSWEPAGRKPKQRGNTGGENTHWTGHWNHLAKLKVVEDGDWMPEGCRGIWLMICRAFSLGLSQQVWPGSVSITQLAFQQNQLLFSVHVGVQLVVQYRFTSNSYQEIPVPFSFLWCVVLDFFPEVVLPPFTSVTLMKSRMGHVNLLFLVTLTRFLSSSPWI